MTAGLALAVTALVATAPAGADAVPAVPAVAGGGVTAATTAAAVPDATASPLTRSVPVRLQVRGIGVDSPLVELGLADDGTLEVPTAAFPAGWYTGAPTPGELGPAVIVGHVDWDGDPGVFHALRDVAPDDEVEVTRQDGAVAVFRVTRVEQVSKGAFPTEAVYGDLDHAGLRLITCGGTFDERSRHYADNIVVFAELVRVDGGDDEDD